MTINIDTYWCWEDQPAVIVDYGNFFGGFLLREGRTIDEGDGERRC